MLWSVWKPRNEKVFSGRPPNFVKLVDLVKSRIAFWSKNNIVGLQYSIQDIVMNLHQVRQSFG